MAAASSQFISEAKRILTSLRQLYGLFAHRAYSVIMFGALFCTLAVKFFHSRRIDMINEYYILILADIAVLLGLEVVLTIICFYWPRKSIIRTAMVFAAIVCTWSVMNAGWLIRTGTQILPTVLLPLVRSPLNALSIIGVNLVKMPVAAAVLLVPSGVALGFFFFSLVKALPPAYNQKRLIIKVFVSFSIIVAAILVRGTVIQRKTVRTVSEDLIYNCQLRAVLNIFVPRSDRLARADFAGAKRTIPAFDQIEIALSAEAPQVNHNIVIVIFEGIQYGYTSLANKESDLTPYLAMLADEGVEFANTHSLLTHTTKVIFSLFTGRFPSASQDIVEAVPVEKPCAGLATVLKQKLNFRTAFFQSAKGNFEARPALVYNLGFDKFWAREDLKDPNSHLGYLASDEFSMLQPITEWIRADDRPFLLAILCSVTHDPYEVPQWFAAPSKDPLERYKQAIVYTDKFIAALDTELARLNLTDKTIFCVIADHGEAFGEHGLLGHERIPFEEALHIPFCIRAPSLVKPETIVTEAVSSVDLTPTLLSLLGFKTEVAGFDGIDALADITDKRKVFFSSWLQQSPIGFITANRKFIYNPTNKKISVYDLTNDPFELFRIEPDRQKQDEIAQELVNWRKNTIFRIDQQRAGKKILFDSWLCRWTNRVCSAKYVK